jgi:hypothetical protein
MNDTLVYAQSGDSYIFVGIEHEGKFIGVGSVRAIGVTLSPDMDRDKDEYPKAMRLLGHKTDKGYAIQNTVYFDPTIAKTQLWQLCLTNVRVADPTTVKLLEDRCQYEWLGCNLFYTLEDGNFIEHVEYETSVLAGWAVYLNRLATLRGLESKLSWEGYLTPYPNDQVDWKTEIRSLEDAQAVKKWVDIAKSTYDVVFTTLQLGRPRQDGTQPLIAKIRHGYGHLTLFIREGELEIQGITEEEADGQWWCIRHTGILPNKTFGLFSLIWQIKPEELLCSDKMAV